MLSSGLYKRLVDSGKLIPHKEITPPIFPTNDQHFKTISPEVIPFISYPYEWSFSQLKDAALLTLDIAIAAVNCGMVLKDASAYNVQFIGAKPIFIDTLSFEKYIQGEPWIAYKQFCQHFLAPITLMSKVDIRLNKLLQSNIDGIPLDLAVNILPFKSLISPSLFFHLFLHAKYQAKHANDGSKVSKKKFSKQAFLGMLSNLKSSIESLNWKPAGTEWADYYQNTNYSDRAFSQKKLLIEKFVSQTNARNIMDLGANTGIISRVAAKSGAKIVACDFDPAAVELNYIHCRNESNDSILPILLDLTSSSPSIGWDNKERLSFLNRVNVDLILALALIHHLAISNNIPLGHIVNYFSKLSKYLLIEFVPKEDSQVVRLLSTRKDIFPHYNIKEFEKSFCTKFEIIEKESLEASQRTLYLMKNTNALLRER
jgi:ribosomal protein L11 methylase PrmA